LKSQDDEDEVIRDFFLSPFTGEGWTLAILRRQPSTKALDPGIRRDDGK
jgi:hypothetical protein